MLIDPQRVVLHVGVPKTGTTTLQRRLFAEHPGIVYLGKPYDRPGVDHTSNAAIAELVDLVWSSTHAEYDQDRAAALLAKGRRGRGLSGQGWRGLSDQKDPRGDRRDDHPPVGPIVLSEEALTQASGGDRDLKARRLRRLFGRCRVLITIREQRDALRSGHRWVYTRRLTDHRLDAWIDHCRAYSHRLGRPDDFPLRQYRYAEVVHTYHRLFGAERVRVMAMEQLRDDPAGFSRSLTDWLGVDDAPRGDATARWRLGDRGPAENASPGRWGMAYQRWVRAARMRRYRRRGERDPLALGEFHEGVHGKVMRTLARLERRRPDYRPATDAWLRDYFAADNRRLGELTGLWAAMAQWGYAL